MQQSITCKICGCTSYIPVGAKAVACFACGNKQPKLLEVKNSDVTPVYDPHSDNLITTCNTCGGKTYSHAPLSHPSECVSPTLCREIWNLKQALDFCRPTRPLYCAHCGSADTESAWYWYAFRIDKFLTAQDKRNTIVKIHDCKKAESKVQADPDNKPMELSWDVLHSFSPTIWNYGGIDIQEMAKVI
jgi:ribosomal protein L37E